MNKLNEDSSNLLSLSSTVCSLCCLNLWDKSLQSRPAPVDSVYLLSDQTKFAQLVCWSFLGGDPSSSQGTRFGIAISNGRLLDIRSLLGSFQSLTVGQLDQLDLSSLQLVCDLITLFNQFINKCCISCNPNVLHGVAKDLAKLCHVEIWFRDRREENSPRRNAIAVDWREEEGLAKVDVEDAFPDDKKEYEAEEEPSAEAVSEKLVLGILAILVDIAHRKHVQLTATISSGDVDWEQPSVMSVLGCNACVESRWDQKGTYTGIVIQAPTNIMTTVMRRNRRKR